MSAYFVAGIGTSVGKTHVVVSMLRALKTSKPLMGLKPVISGFDNEQSQSDTHLILKAMAGRNELSTLDEVSPFRYKAPLSVDMAALKEGTSLCYSSLVDFSHTKIQDTSKSWLIEGVGGVMVPLNQEKTTLDWIKDLNVPVLLVSSTYLGALNHTLCTLTALQSKKIDVAAVIVNQAHDCVGLEQTQRSLRHFMPDIPLCMWARGSDVPPGYLMSLFG